MKLSSSEGALHGDTLVTSVGLTHVKAPYNEYQEELVSLIGRFYIQLPSTLYKYVSFFPSFEAN